MRKVELTQTQDQLRTEQQEGTVGDPAIVYAEGRTVCMYVCVSGELKSIKNGLLTLNLKLLPQYHKGDIRGETHIRCGLFRSDSRPSLIRYMLLCVIY